MRQLWACCRNGVGLFENDEPARGRNSVNGYQTSRVTLAVLMVCATLLACEEGPPPELSGPERPLSENELSLDGLATEDEYPEVARGAVSIVA